MRFFAKDVSQGGGGAQILRAFHETHQLAYPHPAVTLRAARHLCAAGRLIEGEPGLGPPVFSARYTCTKTVAELEPDLTYGTFDFIVGGLAAIRDVLGASVVMLSVDTGSGDLAQGSAFAVLPNLLLTARHCAEPPASVEVVVGSDHLVPFKIIVPNSGVDVAALLLAEPLQIPTFRVRDPVLLEPVLTMGYPRLQGLYPTLMSSGGEVSGCAPAYLDGQMYWITTCAMTGGSSGGPVVGADGIVVGVVSGLPSTDTGIDPGRFGLMSPCVDAVREIGTAFELGRALE